MTAGIGWAGELQIYCGLLWDGDVVGQLVEMDKKLFDGDDGEKNWDWWIEAIEFNADLRCGVGEPRVQTYWWD